LGIKGLREIVSPFFVPGGANVVSIDPACFAKPFVEGVPAGTRDAISVKWPHALAIAGSAGGEPAVCQDAAMTTPTIRLATHEDLRSITSQNLDQITRLPFLYIAGAEPGVMRTWGVAGENTVPDTERLYPGSLVAPRYVGETASRGDLLYNGAEPASDFMLANVGEHDAGRR
jgi:hypothetical protein